jgi:hypothetical protein
VITTESTLFLFPEECVLLPASVAEEPQLPTIEAPSSFVLCTLVTVEAKIMAKSPSAGTYSQPWSTFPVGRTKRSFKDSRNGTKPVQLTSLNVLFF